MERECMAFMRKHLFVKKKQLDTAAIATKRAESVATYGGSHDQEAKGLQMVLEVLRQNGQLICHKSFEKAMADFSVYRPESPHLALGLQLKTTGVFWKQAQTGNEYFSFRSTDGYAGLLMIFVAVHTNPARLWLADGADITSKGVQIAVRPKQDFKSDRLEEISLEEVAERIIDIYESASNGLSNYSLRHYLEHERPSDKNALAEYNAFKQLQQQLPVNFIHPPAEHMSFDFYVNDAKWQLKLARYKASADCYQVNCNKNAGMIDGKRSLVQYAFDDFHFLCIQLPGNLSCCYILPRKVLRQLGLMGDATKSDGYVSVYPHRQVSCRKKVHSDGNHWTDRYRVDFGPDVMENLNRVLALSDQDNI